MQAGLSEQFELRLARSFVEFMNSKSTGLQAFGWVTQELNGAAKALGAVERFKELAGPRDETKLRKTVLNGLRCLEHLQRDSGDLEFAAEFRELAYESLDRQLRALQIVHFWRVRYDGTVLDVALPLLDSVERCCAYVIGLALLDRHNLQRGLKRCRLMATMPPNDRLRQPHLVWHWFIDLPNSKQLYCCPKHAAADRKRRQRREAAASTRKHK